MTTNRNDQGHGTITAASSTERVLAELQLYGYRPFQDEPDPRPLPDAGAITGAVADIFDALLATLTDTRLEADLEELLVNGQPLSPGGFSGGTRARRQ